MKNGSEKRVKIHAHVLRLNVNNTGAAVKFRFARSVRSEERRVGKECRSRLSPDH